MTNARRLERLTAKIQQEISRIIDREFDFQGGILTTVTRVEIAEDLTSARVYISVYPDTEAGTVLKELNNKIWEVQQLFNKRMEMRPVPRLRFVLDESVRVADTIERELYELKNKAQ